MNNPDQKPHPALFSSDRRKFIQSSLVAAASLQLPFGGGKEASSFFLNLPGVSHVYDVVVYGATPAGISAAVAAAREHKSVLIIEPLQLVGGMMSGGLSFSDSNQMARELLKGIFEEFHLDVQKYYTGRGVTLPYDVNVKDSRPWTYEPHVAELIFWRLLKDAKVEVVTGEMLRHADMKGSAISSVVTYSGRRYSGRMFIDASYEGDLMAAAGVSYRVGREGRSEFDESLAGGIYLKKVVPVDPYDGSHQTLPFITGTERLAEGMGDKHIMTYSFRFSLSMDPANRVPFRKPSGYDPAEYELFRRYLKAYPETKRLFDMYPIPGNKIDGNNGIGLQLSTGLVGRNAGYPEGSPEERKTFWAAQRRYCEGLYYFLMTDDSVPAPMKEQMNKMGYSKDEFTRFGHFPPALYVREARRMEGAYFMTQHDILKDIHKPDSIGVISFPNDSHDCQRIALSDTEFTNEGMIHPVHIKSRPIGQPYQFPYRAMVPKAGQCNNLLVPVCVSATHVGFASVRVEPAWMVLGQSAGIAAALALEQGAAVQQLDYRKLASRLKGQGMVLDMPDEFQLG